jgi:hypothetical protein
MVANMAKTKKSGPVSRLTRNIDAWWPVNWSTRPQEPDHTATSFAALRIKRINQAVSLW